MTPIDGANLLKRRLKKIGMIGEYSPNFRPGTRS